MAMSGKYKITVDTTVLDNGDSIAAYLTSAAGALITSTTIGAKEHVDVLAPSDHLDGAAYTAGTDYLSAVAGVDESGNYQPLNINAAGELLVAAAVTFTAEHAEDSAAVSGDQGVFTLLVRQDTLAASTSADGDYGAFKSNAAGELYVHDTSALAELVLIKGDTASTLTELLDQGTTLDSSLTALQAILADTATIDSQTLSIQNTLTALSKAEDAAAVSGDQGIQALAVRKDASGSNVSADGDYSSLQTWSEGSLKVVDVANSAMLQSQISVANTATLLPASALANRRSILVQNTGSSSFFVGSSSVTASGATAGIEVPKGGHIELEAGPAVAVYAITASGSVNANILQMA